MTTAIQTTFFLLEVTVIVLCAFAVPTSVHSESLAPEASSSRQSSSRLRGQVATSPSALFETNFSTGGSTGSLDAGSADLQFLNTTDSKPNQALEDQVSKLFRASQSMSKEQLEATPFKGSVQKILDLIEKVMMVKVEDAHKMNQKELYEISNSTHKCASTKNSQVAVANQTMALYTKFSPLHLSCRATEAGMRTVKEACWEEEADKRTVKNLKCKAFAMVSKQVGDQNAQRQIMKKGGSEEVGSYVERVTATICGGCVGKGCKLTPKEDDAKPKKCGYAPYTCGCGVKCKFQKAKDDCEAATLDWQKHKDRCHYADKAHSSEQKKCDSLQDQTDDSACKRAVEMKDACESYAECYFDHRSAYESSMKMVQQEEIDRKAEWRGLKRMRCLIKAFSGKVKNSEVDACKAATHTTDHLTVDYPVLPPLARCEVPRLYPNTALYKAANFAPLPALAKGKLDAYECAGITEISTKPASGSPHTCKCNRVTMNGPFTPGPLVACTGCLDVRRSQDKNSCPDGTKLFSPQSHSDWKTFYASAQPLRDPHFIIDITRPQNGCGGCQHSAMNSHNPAQRSWKTSDGTPWWLRGTPDLKEPNGDYAANCFLNVGSAPVNRSAEITGTNDHNCEYHSKSYYCQPSDIPLKPKAGSPEACACKQVTLTGKYSAGALIKCTNCLTVSKSTQTNSCPVGTKIFSPRTREDWRTFINSATPLRSPDWIIDVTQAQDGCNGCTKHAMNSHTPALATWMTSDRSPWFLRSSAYSEPNGDYKSNCYLKLLSADSEDSVTFNDGDCKHSSNAYYCQPVKAIPKPPPAEEEQEEESEAPAPAAFSPAPAVAEAKPKKNKKNKGGNNNNNNDNDNDNDNDNNDD